MIREELIKQVENKIWNVEAELWSDLSNEERRYFMREQRNHKEKLEEERKSKVKKKVLDTEEVKEKKIGFENPMEYRPFKDNRKKTFEEMMDSFVKDSKSKIHSIKTEFSSNREKKIEKSENNKRREIALNKRD